MWDDREKSLSSKLARNVLSSGFRVLLLAPIPFVMTPLILREIGPGGYGTWAVFMALGGLTSLADLGMVGAVSKYVAEYHAQNDIQGLSRLVSTGSAMFILLATSLASLVWYCSPLVTKLLLKGSPVENSELVFLVRCFIVVLASNVFILLFSSVTSGLQRLDITNAINSLNTLGTALAGGILLLRGWGLRGLVVGQALSSLVAVGMYCVAIKKLLPQARLTLRDVNGVEARKMFSFSLRLYVTQAAVAVHNQMEKFLLALFVGVEAAGWYDIASSVVLKLRGVVGLVLGPVLPAVSELNALNDEERIKRLYYRAHKYLALPGIGLAFFLSIASPAFIELWIGRGLAFVAAPLVVLMWVNVVNLSTGPGFLTFAGKSHLRPGVQSALLGLSLNIALSVVLIFRFGFAGAVVGTSISLFFASLFFVVIFHRQTGYSVWQLFRDAYAKPIVVGMVLSLPSWLVVRELTPSWAALIGWALGFGLCYLGGLLALRFFDPYDWGKAESLLPAIRYVRRLVPGA